MTKRMERREEKAQHRGRKKFQRATYSIENQVESEDGRWRKGKWSTLLKIFFFNMYLFCGERGECHSLGVEVREQLVGTDSLSTTWIPGTESGYQACGRRLDPLSCLWP